MLVQPMVPTGIPLSKIHHATFDAHPIRIYSNYRIHVAGRLMFRNDGPMIEALKHLHHSELHLPALLRDRSDRDRLAARFERFRTAT